MKKIAICLIILILVMIPFSVFSAQAEETGEKYIVGSTEVQAWVSDGFTPTIAFSIPKGYGFIVVNANFNSEYAEVSYSGRNYYVEKTKLATCTKADESATLSPTLIVELDPKTVYGKPDLSESKDFYGTVMFLGEYKENGTMKSYAVYDVNAADKKIYYVSPKGINNLSAIQELLNPSQIKPSDNQKPTPSTPVTDTNDKTPQNKTILRIILVLGIVIPAFIIILIVFKPGRKKNKVEREVDEGTDAFDNY